jgi:hypothetical protein
MRKCRRCHGAALDPTPTARFWTSLPVCGPCFFDLLCDRRHAAAPWPLHLHLMHRRSCAAARVAALPARHGAAHVALHARPRALLRSRVTRWLRLHTRRPRPPLAEYSSRNTNIRPKDPLLQQKRQSRPHPSIAGPHNVYARTPPFSATTGPRATARRGTRQVVASRGSAGMASSVRAFSEILRRPF